MPGGGRHSRSDMKRKQSSGGIVYRFSEGEPEVLFILDAFGRWALPKGGVEQGEGSAEAALREIAEETGILGNIERPLGSTTYFYRDESGDLVRKTVTYYLVKAVGGSLKPQRGEAADARWVPASMVRGLYGYPGNGEILGRALRIIQELGRSS